MVSGESLMSHKLVTCLIHIFVLIGWFLGNRAISFFEKSHLSGSEKHFGQTKLVVVLIQTQSFEQSLKQEQRKFQWMLWCEKLQDWRRGSKVSPYRRGVGRAGSVWRACTSGTCCRVHGKELWRGTHPASGPEPRPYLQNQQREQGQVLNPPPQSRWLKLRKV